MTLLQLAWLHSGLLLLTPAIVLAVVLLLGRYPGEELLVRVSERPLRRRRRGVLVRLVRVAPVLHVGGGLLLARSLAGRAPPAVSVPS